VVQQRLDGWVTMAWMVSTLIGSRWPRQLKAIPAE